MNKTLFSTSIAISSILVSIVIAQSRPSSSSVSDESPDHQESRKASTSGAPNQMESMSEFPPVVISTIPMSGETLKPGRQKISVTFSEKMTDKSWSWTTVPGAEFPEIVNGPYYESDGRTCSIEVNLEPDTIYGSWLNSANFLNFRDMTGQAAVPYLIFFQTAKE